MVVGGADSTATGGNLALAGDIIGGVANAAMLYHAGTKPPGK
jgi:hypothetical protein